MPTGPKIRVVQFKAPKTCVCPACKVEQPFKKAGQRWKKVRDVDLEHPTFLQVHVLRAKCQNPACPTRTFSLPLPGVGRYARATNRLKTEALAGIVQDNSTAPRIAKRLARSFNTTGSSSSIYRWLAKEAEKYSFEEIIPQLEFSGILSLDEYMPTRAHRYELVAGDAVKGRLLYREAVNEFYGRGYIKQFVLRLKDFGLNPWAIVFDLLTAFPKQVRDVWPGIIIQFDYFHVQQWIHRHFKNAVLQFRRSLKGKTWELYREELWEHKWSLLKDMAKWREKEHLLIPDLIQVYAGTVVEKVLIFKEQLWDIFDNSQTKQEAYQKRDALAKETWWHESWHLCQVINFLKSGKFDYMITYLEYPAIPRTGNSEILNSLWRQIESPRFGFKTEKSRQSFLKLYQISRYLDGQLHRK